jgi:hypothetical protein
VRVRFNLSRILAVVFGLFLLTLAVHSVNAQDIFGTINGTVTDKSGGVVADAKVTITNEATGLSQTIEANDKGYFVAESLPVGTYTVTIDQDKFKTSKKTGNVLVAGGHLTVNATLEVGATSEVIEVSATGVSINTTSAELSRTVDANEIVTRSLNERNYVELITLVPGAVLTSFDQTAFTTGMSIAPANINGVRTDANLVTVDGGFNMDSGSNGTQLNNVGLDFIQEVNVQTSNYSAEYGRSFGSSIDVVTKSGGNKFHGTLFEYARNQDFDAKPAFSPKLELRYNDFGGDVGGWIVRKKLFFFGGVEAKRLVLPGDGPAKTLTLPTSPELVGNFADAGVTLKAQGTVTAASGCIGSYSGGAGDVNPADFIPNTSTGTGTALNPTCISSGGKAISNIYKMMETPGATPESAAAFTNAATANNATFAPVTPQNWSEYIGRLDYHPNDAHTIFFRAIYDHLILVDPFGPFSPGGALPTSPQLRIRPGYSFQLGDVWTVNSHLVNEAKFTVAWNKQRIPPTGNLWQQSTYGFTSTNYVEPFPGVGPFPTGIPSGTYSGTCPTTTCPAEFLGPYEFLLAPTVDISPSDNVSWQVRNHTIKFGVLYARNRKDQNSRTDATQGQLNFSSTNPNTTGDQFADSLLGNYNSLSQFSADPIGHFRFNDWGSYIQDSWRVTRRLSLEFGLRVDYTVPIYTQANNAVNFDPSLYTAIPGLTISSGNIPTAPVGSGLVFDCPQTSATPGACNPGAGGGGYVVTGLVRPGGVPADQLGRVPNGNSPFVLDVPAGAQRGFYKPEVTPAPRVGVAFTPFGENTVIRAGAGLYFDRPEGNIIFGQTGIVPFLQQVSFLSGNLATLPASGSAPTIFGVSAINPNLVVARVVSYSLSIQHEFRGGIMVQAAYVGNEARHLIREPNINVPTFAAAAAAPVGATINQVRPFLGYTDISQFLSDGTSNYNSFQLSASKTKGFATIQVSYTYGNALGNANGLNDNPEPECAITCKNASGQTISWKQFDYGPLSFDIRNAFVASYTLNEPWFKDRKGVSGVFISGWSLSGITRAQSGFPLTVTGSVADGTLSGESFTDRANMTSVPLTTGIGTCINSATHLCYFNPLTTTGSFTSAGMATGIGNAPIGNIIGPGYYSWDLSLRKNFRLPIESMGFMIQLDAFNAFNRINYQNPSTTVTSSSFGQITASQPPRQLQLGAKFTF